MAYCSIEEAFPVEDLAGSPASVARKEERRRAKMCKGPALAFLKAGGDLEVDVDRQGYGLGPEPELLSGVKGRDTGPKELREGYSDAPDGRDIDVIGSSTYKKNASLPDAKTVAKTTELPKLSAEVPSYFGRSEEDAASTSAPAAAPAKPAPAPRSMPAVEKFANYSSLAGDNPGYQLAPDFLGTFGAVGYDKSAGKALLGTPNLNDAWKPLTPSGAQTSFVSEWMPSSGRSQRRSSESSWGGRGDGMSREEKEILLKRIDLLFAKLERLESGRNENAQTEIALFVMSGLFLMFGMDLVRRAAVGRGA